MYATQYFYDTSRTKRIPGTFAKRFLHSKWSVLLKLIEEKVKDFHSLSFLYCQEC